MYNLLIVADAAPEPADRLIGALREAAETLPGGGVAAAGRTLPRALNGGALMLRLTFATEAGYHACRASAEWTQRIEPLLGQERDELFYRSAVSDTSRSRGSEGIWRCLALAVEPFAAEASVRQFERDLLLMPDHVKAIRNWSLGHVLATTGRRRWTHVWEQEFVDVAALEGEYMMHPIHWGLVDGWFDPECPQRIVDPFLIHAAFDITGSVIR